MDCVTFQFGCLLHRVGVQYLILCYTLQNGYTNNFIIANYYSFFNTMTVFFEV